MNPGKSHHWQKTMELYNKSALKHYMSLRETVIVDGKLSKKEKHLILLGVNAARRYEMGMIHHAKEAYRLGATVGEVVEILTSCILSRGIPAWLEGVKVIELALKEKSIPIEEQQKEINKIDNLEKAIDYFKNENNEVIPEWVLNMKKYSPQSLVYYASLRQNELRDSIVSRKLKELVLVGINISERYKLGVELHVKGAKREGATFEEIAEVGLICLLTSGIPAWFEISDYLSKE